MYWKVRRETFKRFLDDFAGHPDKKRVAVGYSGGDKGLEDKEAEDVLETGISSVNHMEMSRLARSESWQADFPF